MAEDKDESQEKTQDPTSRRLEKAREDGKVVSSQDRFFENLLDKSMREINKNVTPITD